MIRIAIVGIGSWGVCALERVITTSRQEANPGRRVKVHVIEPATPGAGVYGAAQPDYLLLNNACGELTLYPFEGESDQPRYAVGLYEWTVAQGYRWVGRQCLIDPAGQPITRHDYLPRRLLAEYLHWFYETLVAEAPPGVEVVHHPTVAIDLVEQPDGSELVCLADGESVVVDHVIVTSGHTANLEEPGRAPHERQLAAYPPTAYDYHLGATAKVAVSGIGLVAIDVVTMLTIGRGGGFVDGSTGLRYRPSGHEPAIQLYSRGGLPFTGKSVTGVDRTDVYQPAIATPEKFARLRACGNGGKRQVDIRSELLPLLFAEMDARYYAQRAFHDGGLDAARSVRAELGAGWNANRYGPARGCIAARYGTFDPEALFFGPEPSFASSDDYERATYDMLASDLREAEVADGRSPIKSAAEVFRIFRDPMRSVIDHGGLTLDSYLDFNGSIRSRIHRLVAGPPALRTRQFMALMEAGLLRIPFGPAPALGAGSTRSTNGWVPTRISSTQLDQSYAGDVDVIIKGHLDDPRIDRSASMLLSRLLDRGRINQFHYGAVNVGSVDITPDGHPIDLDGQPQTRIWLYGVLTEGVRHFTWYVPSPRSRIRAVQDIGAGVAEILA